MLPRSKIIFRNYVAPPPCSYGRKIHVLFLHANRELPCEGIFILCFPMSTWNCYASTYGKSTSCFLMSTGNCLVRTDGKSASFVFSCRQRTVTTILTERPSAFCFIMSTWNCYVYIDGCWHGTVAMPVMTENPRLVFSCRQGPAVSGSGKHRVCRHVLQAGGRDVQLW